MTQIASSDLEKTYDALAMSIDKAGPGKTELFLVKLGLLLANELNDQKRFSALCETALLDL